MEPRLKGNL